MLLGESTVSCSDALRPAAAFHPTRAVKHDRYNGYDPSDYAKVVERYDAVEALKNEKKKEKVR